jgi:hypothetical protein
VLNSPSATEKLCGVKNISVGMEFSDTYKHSGHCVFSPDARFLAVAVDYRLVIRDAVSLKVRCMPLHFPRIWFEQHMSCEY